MNIKEAAINLSDIIEKYPGANNFFKSDIAVVFVKINGEQDIYSSVSTRNFAGYIPGVSTITGSYRIAKNLIKIIYHVADLIFGNFLALYHIKHDLTLVGRGFLEIMPVVGNLIVFQIDQTRIKNLEKEIKGDDKYQPSESSYVAFYANHRLLSIRDDENYSNLQKALTKLEDIFRRGEHTRCCAA